MPALSEYLAYLLELMRPLGGISFRHMFGGVCLYKDDVPFAIIADDILYLKVDNQNRSEFEHRYLDAFSYISKGKTLKLSYYRAPDEALESSADMKHWALSAYAAGLRNRKLSKPPGRAKSKAIKQ